MPPALKNKPELYSDLHEVLLAFQILSSARTTQYLLTKKVLELPNPISIFEIIAYYNNIYIEVELPDFIRLIQTADYAHIQYVRKKNGSS